MRFLDSRQIISEWFDISDLTLDISMPVVEPKWFEHPPPPPHPWQNGSRFADDIFECIFVKEKFWILIIISLKFVPKGPIDNNPALVEIRAWRRIGDKTLSEPMLTQFTDEYMRH